jgi:hypothetical protein
MLILTRDNMKILIVRLKTLFRMARGKEYGATPSIAHLVSKRKVKESTYLQNLVSAGVLEDPQCAIPLDC